MDIDTSELIKPIGELRGKIAFLENLRNFYQELYQNLDLSEEDQRERAQYLWDEADRQLETANEKLTRWIAKQ
jgi:hypothetical protein